MSKEILLNELETIVEKIGYDIMEAEEGMEVTSNIKIAYELSGKESALSDVYKKLSHLIKNHTHIK